jgi:hypothetical protein
MSAVARQRSDSSPQKHKSIRQPSFADAVSAEAESKLEEDRKRRDEEAAKRREERRRLDDVQRRQDEEDAEAAARSIVESASRIARMKVDEQQRRQQLRVPQQTDEEIQPLSSPSAAAVPLPQRHESPGVSPARGGAGAATSPVKKYLRNELRSGRVLLLFRPNVLIRTLTLRSAVALKNKSMHGGGAASPEPSSDRKSGARSSATEGFRSLSRMR